MSQEGRYIATSRQKTGKKIAQTFSLYHTITALVAQGKTMAERDETQQEKQNRWATQRDARDQEQHVGQAARRRRTARTWLIVGVIVIIGVVIAVVVRR
jgi:t-SNARE complex subunit (syntaxin)